MALSRRVVETLLDLVEIKLSCMEIYDREDTREADCLERCRSELREALKSGVGASGSGAVAAFAKRAKGRSRATA